MQLLILWVVGAFAKFLPFIIARVLTVCGVAVVSYAGLTAVFNSMAGYVGVYLGQLSSDILAILHMGGVIGAINYLLACWAARVAVRATSLGIRKA